MKLVSRRDDFPLLAKPCRGKPLVYLDSSATSQKPHCVIEAIQHYYATDNANIHRGLYELSERATAAYEAARVIVQRFINAPEAHEIIFVRGATEAINLVAQSYGRSCLKAGDEIIISTMEHHSNIVPWQLLAEQIGASLKIIPVTEQGEIDLTAYQQLLTAKTKPKLVAIAHASNVLGTINPLQQIIAMAHAADVPVLVDGAQAVPHLPVDVQALDCDFYVFSGHKAYAPMGIGVLYGKTALLEAMPPYQGGGDMIESVSFAKSTYNKLPFKFEAGTPNVGAAIGLGRALTYLQEIGMQTIHAHEVALLSYATHQLSQLPEVKLIGTAADKVGVISFVMQDIHPHDIGTILDDQGIAIRAGHHCAMPLMERFGVPATARISFGLYNEKTDVDVLLQGLEKVKKVFG